MFGSRGGRRGGKQHSHGQASLSLVACRRKNGRRGGAFAARREHGLWRVRRREGDRRSLQLPARQVGIPLDGRARHEITRRLTGRSRGKLGQGGQRRWHRRRGQQQFAQWNGSFPLDRGDRDGRLGGTGRWPLFQCRLRGLSGRCGDCRAILLRQGQGSFPLDRGGRDDRPG